MGQLSETARLDRELEQARCDLRETLEQVNHKLEAIEARLRPQAILRKNPITLALAAGLLGLFAGSERRPRSMQWLVMGAALGMFLATGYRGNSNGDDATRP